MYMVKEKTEDKDKKYNCACNRYNENGANNDIFTPPHLAEYMWRQIENHGSDIEDANILDPCCGTGNLLKPIQHLFKNNNITAVEINNEYVNQIDFDLNEINFYHSCFFEVCFDRQFDIIIMNPPFSIKAEKQRPGLTAFVDRCLALLNDDGIIITLAPEYWLFNCDARKWKYQNNIKSITSIPELTFGAKHNNFIVEIVKQCPNKLFYFTKRQTIDFYQKEKMKKQQLSLNLISGSGE